MNITKIASPDEFIAELHAAATELYQRTGLYASVTLAQAALETGWLKFLPHDLQTGQNSYNIYGVKGLGPAGSVQDYTQESINGQWITIIAEFAAYHDYLESMLARAQLLLDDARYKPVLQAGNPFVASYALQDSGYATDPNYGAQLVEIIRQYELTRFDLKEATHKPSAAKFNVIVGWFDSAQTASNAAQKIKQQLGYHTNVKKV